MAEAVSSCQAIPSQQGALSCLVTGAGFLGCLSQLAPLPQGLARVSAAVDPAVQPEVAQAGRALPESSTSVVREARSRALPRHRTPAVCWLEGVRTPPLQMGTLGLELVSVGNPVCILSMDSGCP